MSDQHPLQRMAREYAQRLQEGVDNGDLDHDLALASLAADTLAWSLQALQRGDQIGTALMFETAATAARERWMSLQARATPVPDDLAGLED